MKLSTSPYLQTLDTSGEFIFISYSHDDREIMEPIAEQLARDGYRFWFDDGTEGGETWQETVPEKITECTVFLLLITKNMLHSKNCRDELTYAKTEEKTILPAFLSDINLKKECKAVDFQLGNYNHVNFYEYKEDEKDLLYKKLYNSKDFNACKRSDEEQHEFLKEIGQADDTGGEKSADETKKKNEPKQPTKPVVMNSPVKNTDGGHDDENYISYVTYIFKKLKEFFSSKYKKDDISFNTDTIALPARTNQKKNYCSKVKEKIVDIFTNILSSKVTAIVLTIVTIVAITFYTFVIFLFSSANNLGIEERIIVFLLILCIGFSVWFILSINDVDDKIFITLEKAFSQLKKIYVTDNMFLGKKEVSDRGEFIDSVLYQKIKTGDAEIEISAVPFYTSVDPTYNGVILLGFLDRFGKEYYFHGEYSIDKNKLSLLHDAIQFNLSDNGNNEAATPEQAYSDKERKLLGVMTFFVFPESGGLQLKSENFKSSVILKNKQESTNGYFTLRGTATKDCFNELKYISISYSPDGDAKVEKLMFDDSGTPLNASVTYTPNKNRILIKWADEKRLYNGRMETFSKAGEASFQFVNTAPYGFVLIGDHGKTVYSYQAEADPAFFESDTEK